MSEEWMKAAMWGLVTLVMLIVLWSSWRTYRADQAKLQKLQDFRDRYDAEMSRLYHWFDSDECALTVLDWLDRQLAGGDLRPDDSRRLDVASQGLQAVRQAVRNSHFNDRCRGAADASCAMSASATNQPRVTPEQMADLRHAYLEGVDLDVFMALCLNQLLEGRTVKVISERREYLNPRPELAPFDRISEPVVRRIVNDLGEQVWPAPSTVDTGTPADASPESRPHQVEVIYEMVEPTVDEKVDEVLRLMRLFENAWDKSPRTVGREEQRAMKPAPVSEVERETIRAVFLRNGFTIKEGQTDLKPYVYAAAEELLSIALASWQRTQSAPVSQAERLPLESLEPLKRPVPSGWAVKRSDASRHEFYELYGLYDEYLGPLDGWLQDPRRAVLFGNKEAAIAVQAALSVDPKLPISVVWLVYDPVFDTYREQAQ